MLKVIFCGITLLIVIGIIVFLLCGYTQRKTMSKDYVLDLTKKTTYESATIVEQWAAAEERLEKERTWINEVKELCKLNIVKLSRRLPVGVSRVEHYNNIIDEVYYRAMSTNANYFIIASNWLPIFSFTADFEMTETMPIQGSYVAGTYKGLPIIVSPCLGSFEMICGADTPTPEYNTAAIDMNKFMFIKLED